MVLYAPQHQVLISGGKKGEVCIFDVRQRQLQHTFQAHDNNVAIKCLALDAGAGTEECFVTGGADGDIKVCSACWIRLVHDIRNIPVSSKLRFVFFSAKFVRADCFNSSLMVMWNFMLLNIFSNTLFNSQRDPRKLFDEHRFSRIERSFSFSVRSS